VVDTTQSAAENPFFVHVEGTGSGQLKVEFPGPTGGRYEGTADIVLVISLMTGATTRRSLRWAAFRC
jgi:hypothetical protein